MIAISATNSAFGLILRSIPIRNTGGGSRVGRTANRELDVEKASICLDKDFFGREVEAPPASTEQEFERQFHMPRKTYEKLRETIMSHDSFFLKIPDATGRLGATTDLKIFAALQMLVDGRSAFSLKQQTRISGHR